VCVRARALTNLQRASKTLQEEEEEGGGGAGRGRGGGRKRRSADYSARSLLVGYIKRLIYSARHMVRALAYTAA